MQGLCLCAASALPVCASEDNTNYSGDLITDGAKNLQNTTADCCASCSATPGCNVWVYCQNYEGCDNGSGIMIPANVRAAPLI